MICFSHDHFKQLATHNNYELCESIWIVLQYLDNIIEEPPDMIDTIPLTRSNRSFDRNGADGNGRIRRKGHHRGGSRENLSNMVADLEAVRNFKTTTVVEKVGIDKHIGNIRMQLNKLSSKNYATQKVAVIECITGVFATSFDDDECSNISSHERIANSVFDIASGNKFLSEVYADLYVELIGQNELFGDILDGLILKYRDSLNDIVYVHPDTDYDGFCDYNKKNDLRKASAAFIMNLMVRSMISHYSVLELICELLDRTMEYIEIPGKTNEVDEITENVFLLISMGKNDLSRESLWADKIAPFVRNFVKLKAKEHASLSSRCIFKYMDIDV
jgi:hypothetical protein